MDNKSKEKMLLAALTKVAAKRDEVIYKIQSLLDADFDENRDDVSLLEKYFKKLAVQELQIETMQVFYGRHFGAPELEPEKEETQKKSNEDDNPA